MGLDFDAVEYCRNLRLEQQPPFKCPIDKCEREYKSSIGLQYHLIHFDHDNPFPMSPYSTPLRRRGRQRTIPLASTTNLANIPPKEAFTYSEQNKTVQFDILDKSIKVPISQEIPVMDVDEYAKLVATGECAVIPEVPPEPPLKLPVAAFQKIESYYICDAPPRPNAYIRFIEKSTEELDGEVEYDVDEEDTTWLSIINEKREDLGLPLVSVDTLELLMDRLEKESYFQASANGQNGAVVDDDAVCCICMDGECQNTNVILFCDMCNLAVHQDCYGVPYIPEGQWLCRRCLQSPSRPVDCVLCPNKGGAFKQTDRNDWAHVVCALWIPEVRFANTVFLEPIDSIENITPARWKLTCYICKQKGVGACIQCHRNNCYTAFHVTCAQQAGLHMRMDTVRTGNESHPITVQKTAFCDAHAPPSHNANINEIDSCESSPEKAREENRNKMKQARKMLAKKRSSVPVILIPTIPAEKIQEISTLVNIQKKNQFLSRLVAYWTLKRQYRNGVPLLRRLQSQGQSHGNYNNRSGIEGSPDTSELYQQLKYWQCLRQDLERARLLCELVRKREKYKALQIKITEQIVMMELNPLGAALNKLLDALESKEAAEIFLEPVDVNEVPDYTDIVKHPMDLSTMRAKVKSGAYTTFDKMEADFDLMIKNCLAYNEKDTIFYRAGIKMREIGHGLFKFTRKELEDQGLIEAQKNDQTLIEEIDKELKIILSEKITDKSITRLNLLLEKANIIKGNLMRAKKCKTIKLEITKAKKSLVKETVKMEPPNPVELNSQNDFDVAVMDVKTPPCSPFKSASTYGSPSGVNRRTAVLFTRKAQAALKKPVENQVKDEISINEQITPTVQSATTKSPKRHGRTSKNCVIPKILDDIQINDKKLSPKKSDKNKKFEEIPDSFRVYRAQPNRDGSDSDDSNISYTETSCSSCSGMSDSNSDSNDLSSSFGDDNDNENNSEILSTDQETISTKMRLKSLSPSTTLPTKSQGSISSKSTTSEKSINDKDLFKPLQLVWAKCRGYPWYPALIIDPKIPKGYVYNGVPLPAPPQDVLNLRKNYTEFVYLVLFFDVKRTWQWLPSNKLELLGLDKQLDQSKLVESRKPTDKKAVKKAYHNALQYQSQVASSTTINLGKVSK